MNMTFEEFSEEVESIVKTMDFKDNKRHLKKIRQDNWSTFIELIKLGNEIVPSALALNEIFKISKETRNSENEIIKIMLQLRTVELILNETKY